MKNIQLALFCGLFMLPGLWQNDALASNQVTGLGAKERLGKRLFFDVNLSQPPGQSCASCHAPEKGFTDPRPNNAVSEGVHRDRFTSRNAPTVMYLASVPRFHLDKSEGIYIGGLFHDGRANSLQEQVAGPMFSAVEMANTDKAEMVQRLKRLGYLAQFQQVYGDKALVNTPLGYQQLTDAITAYEQSHELNPYSSKYDAYLRGQARLTEQERRGLKLFEDEKKGNCAACHPTNPQDDGTRPMFTDFSYDNLGVPANPENPFLQLRGKYNPQGHQFVDIGLGKTVKSKSENGKFKVPTLRNIEITGPYMHNGVFKTLTEVVEFYNTRDVDEKWGKPEVAENVNKDELGDLKLNKQEVEDIIAFLKTLTDGNK